MPARFAINFLKAAALSLFLAAGQQAQNGDQLSWDSWLNSYLGGHVQEPEMLDGALDPSDAPGVLRCPADVGPDMDWVAEYPGAFARRTYAMISVGPTYGTQYQVPCAPGHYTLPPITNGVGIYWDGGPKGDWDAPGYPTTVVVNPTGTILLAEEAGGRNVVGNVWPCICIAPNFSQANDNGELYQIDANEPFNEGKSLYALHGMRFNYLFHDGHVQALKIEQTVGAGTTNSPKGMWTVAAND